MAASVSRFDESSLRPAAGAGPSRSPAARIGKYEVEREIGCGGLIKVFRAFDREIDRPVALKVLTAVADHAVVARFRREVADMARLRTPRVVSIYELGEHVGFPFAALQAPSDNDLKHLLLCRSPLTLLQKMLILWQVGEGLQAAQQAGIGFVRLRPSGVALDRDGQAALHDFGIVRLTPSDDEDQSAYTSPEEAAGDSPDIVSDIYTLGVIFRELLGADMPRSLAPTVNRATQRRRDLRHHSVEEFREDVEPVLIELKNARSQELLSAARRLMNDSALDEAQSAVREILQLEPDNRDAQRLRAELRNVVRRATLRPLVESLLHEAEEETAARRFSRANEILEAAPELEGSESDLESRLKELRLRVEHGLHAASLAAEARALLLQNKLDEAREKAHESFEWDPESPEAGPLLKSIDDAIERHLRESRIEEGLAKAKSLLLLQSFQAAIQTLTVLDEEFPGVPEVEQCLDQVRRQQAEVLRQARLQRQLKEARALMEQERYNGAILVLSDLLQEFPEEAQVSGLLDEACKAKDRALAIAEASAECARWRAEGDYDQALATLESALADYPDDSHLASLKSDIRQQAVEARDAAEAARILEETDWLVQQDRLDLAAQSLREKASAYPGRTELGARLVDVEKMLPAWEARRLERESLERVASLESLGQWSVAVTVVEEALETSPDSKELKEAAERLRARQREQERSRKLARRLEMIEQKMNAESWPHALLLIEAAEREFPGEPELDRLHREAKEHGRCAQMDQIAVEVRQALADGDIDQAEEMVRKAEAAHGEAALFGSLRQESAAARKYLEEWRAAQVLFGRRQFDEAEKILLRLAGENRPDALVLLEKVREARAAAEEDSFYKRGREKALKLMEEKQWRQAADLLTNLLALFPGDPILERDLKTVESAGLGDRLHNPETRRQDPASAGVAAAVAVAPAPNPPSPAPAPAPAPTLDVDVAALAPEHRPMLAGILPLPAGPLPVIGAAVVLLASAGAGVRALTHRNPAPAPPVRVAPAQTAAAPTIPVTAAQPPVVEPAAQQQPVAAPSTPAPQREASPAPTTPRAESRKAQEPRRVFDPSTLTANSKAQPTPTATLPPAGAVQSPIANPQVDGRLLGNPTAPAPPAPPAAAPKPAPQNNPPAQPATGKFVPAVRLSGATPKLPPFAQQLSIRRGAVTLVVAVDSHGVVRGVTPIDGHPVLATAAKDAVMSWKYRPATLDGKAVDSKVEVHVRFEENQ